MLEEKFNATFKAQKELEELIKADKANKESGQSTKPYTSQTKVDPKLSSDIRVVDMRNRKPTTPTEHQVPSTIQ